MFFVLNSDIYMSRHSDGSCNGLQDIHPEATEHPVSKGTAGKKL